MLTRIAALRHAELERVRAEARLADAMTLFELLFTHPNRAGVVNAIKPWLDALENLPPGWTRLETVLRHFLIQADSDNPALCDCPVCAER